MVVSNMARILCTTLTCAAVLVILFVNQSILTRTHAPKDLSNIDYMTDHRDPSGIHYDTKMPSYPITASWFKDRFSTEEWDSTLDEFSSIGGDTVWLRAPAFTPRTKEDILRDPNFEWCQSTKPNSKGDCVSQAENELAPYGFVIKTFATYQFEEDFSEKILFCPLYDIRMNSSRVYHRLVLPVYEVVTSESCPFDPGTEVVVLFTSFSGIDPHQLLVESASRRRISVYFGLPAAPSVTSGSEDLMVGLLSSYYNWILRVLTDHEYRFAAGIRHHGHKKIKSETTETASDQREHYNLTLLGYYATNEKCLAELTDSTNHYMDMYTALGRLVHTFNKKFVLSPYIVLNKSQRSYSAKEHVDGFEMLARSGAVDVIAVQEGRGCAKGCYYWPTQEGIPIEQVDPVLDDIVRFLDPTVLKGVTYKEQFTDSNNKMFSEKTSELNRKGVQFDFWLNIEAFEFLRTDPCLPVDRSGSGMAELLQRSTKPRLDWALTVAGAAPSKIISFAWDADFTCATKRHATSLVEDILSDHSRPILSNCTWNHTGLRRIDLLGYNLNRMSQTFQVFYTDKRGLPKSHTLRSTYIDARYGEKHHKVMTLQHAQLELTSLTSGLATHGIVNISAFGAYHHCVFKY